MKAATVRKLAANDTALEIMRKAIEDELIDWRDEGRFMVCGNGFSVRWQDGSPSEIIRFRTDVGLRIALNALADAIEDAS